MSIYKHTKERQDLRSAIANLCYVYPEQLEGMQRAINEACGKNIFSVPKQENVETKPTNKRSPETKFDQLIRLFETTGYEEYLQDLTTMALSDKCPKEKLAHIKRVVWMIDRN